MEASHPGLQAPITLQPLPQLVAIVAYGDLDGSCRKDDSLSIHKNLVAKRVLSVGIGINHVFHGPVSALPDLVEEIASVERAVRCVDYYDSLRRDDKAGSAGTAELRVSFLVEDIIRHPDKYVRLDFADFVKRPRRCRGKLEVS